MPAVKSPLQQHFIDARLVRKSCSLGAAEAPCLSPAEPLAVATWRQRLAGTAGDAVIGLIALDRALWFSASSF